MGKKKQIEGPLPHANCRSYVYPVFWSNFLEYMCVRAHTLLHKMQLHPHTDLRLGMQQALWAVTHCGPFDEVTHTSGFTPSDKAA